MDHRNIETQGMSAIIGSSLDIDFNDALYYYTNHIQRKYSKKAQKVMNRLPGVRPFWWQYLMKLYKLELRLKTKLIF